MNLQFFDTPSSREEFERKLNLLGELMRAGRYFVAPGLSHTIDGIRRVRFLPNRRIDLLTVDESTRLNANMMSMAFDRGRDLAGPGENDEGIAPDRGEDDDEE